MAKETDIKEVYRFDMHHRLTNHPPESSEVEEKMDAATEMHIKMAEFIIETVPHSRELDVALQKLEEMSMFVKAGIARNQ
ncbi:MAG TPA: hypothetical protein VJQ25_02455 [Nitrospira sp.]|nr:hypothetical protein [Nitrospira sp.]